jgi:hypothetical protein
MVTDGGDGIEVLACDSFQVPPFSRSHSMVGSAFEKHMKIERPQIENLEASVEQLAAITAKGFCGRAC